MSPDTIITRLKVLLSCDLENEAVLLDPRQGLYYGLNPVAAAIWNLLDQPRSLAEIEARVLKTFEVTADVCRRDVLAFLGDLEKASLIEIAHASAA